jgi:hypothetical protein
MTNTLKDDIEATDDVKQGNHPDNCFVTLKSFFIKGSFVELKM